MTLLRDAEKAVDSTLIHDLKKKKKQKQNQNPLSTISLGGSIINLIKDINQKTRANAQKAFLLKLGIRQAGPPMRLLFNMVLWGSSQCKRKKILERKKNIPLTELSKCVKNKEAKLSLFGREICIGKSFSYKNLRQSAVKLLELRIEENENTQVSIPVIYR